MPKRSWGAAFSRGLGYAASALQGASFSYNPTYNTKTTQSYGNGGPAGGVRFSKERHRVGRRRRTERIRMRDLLKGFRRHRYRWQMTSASLLGPGRIPLSYGLDTTSNANFETLPIHMMSLTTLPNGESSHEKCTHKKGLFRFVRDSTDGRVGWNWFDNQKDVGVNDYTGTGQWQLEESFPNMAGYTESVPSTGNVYHKWTEIRLNLYGAKYLPLEYTISIVSMPKEYDPQQIDSWVPQSTNLLGEFNECSRMLEDIVRGLISNPINVTGTKQHWKDNVKIVKQYKINMAPLSYSNASDETTAPVHVGNVKQFRTFIRHDRFRNYQWSDNATNVNVDRELDDLGWDQKVKGDRNWSDVEPGKKLYLMISVTTGPLVDSKAYDIYKHLPNLYTSMPNTEGTYDIMVRNEFMCTGFLF